MSSSDKEQRPRLPDDESSQGVQEAMVTLLGRLVFPPEQLTKIITKGKRNPTDYLRGYNLCDGEHTPSQIASEIHVQPRTLTSVLHEWKDMGIIHEVGKKGSKFYKRLYRLEVPKPDKEEKTEAKEQPEEGSSDQETQGRPDGASP